jgi:hypothetical protein
MRECTKPRRLARALGVGGVQGVKTGAEQGENSRQGKQVFHRV